MALTPREIVDELDKYIIGQDEAKRAVAIALRNRYSRNSLPEEIRAVSYTHLIARTESSGSLT